MTDYLTFSISEDEEIKCDYNIDNMDAFLGMLCMLLSGQITTDIIDNIFSDIEDENIRTHFISRLYDASIDQLEKKNDELVVKPSKYKV